MGDMATCGLLGCGRTHSSKGLCEFHYTRKKHGRPLDAPIGYRYGPKPFFDWAACGSTKQYRKHLRHNIPMCEACRRAENRRTQDRKRAQCQQSAA